MMKEYDVIVVGGGLAGLTGAAYLSQYGYQTLLCEKAPKTGGLVNTFCYNGYYFDAGIRAFENSGILIPMLKSLEIEMEFVRNPVRIGIGDRWTKLDGRDSLQSYETMLKALFPQNSEDITCIMKEIHNVMNYMDVLYGIENPIFMDGQMSKEYLMKTLLPWLIKYQINIRKAEKLQEPIYNHLKKITENLSLIDMIAQHFFHDTPTFFALSYFGLYMDYMYPKGGTGVLAGKMTDKVLTLGGEIRTKATVTEVDIENKQLLINNEESYRYKKLIWAADQRTLYSNSTVRPTRQITEQKALVNQGRGGDSVLSVFLGINIDKEYFEERCGDHSFYTPTTSGISCLPDWQETKDKEHQIEWTKQYLKASTFEISCPALRDSSLAPDGKTGVIISLLMDYGLVKSVSDAGYYHEWKDLCTEEILQIFNDTIFPGISEKVEFTLCSTPLTIERETGNWGGAITGWSFTNEKAPSENRFRKILSSIKTPITDVYQCGQWTFSPSGLPVSVLTGKLAADAIRKDFS